MTNIIEIIKLIWNNKRYRSLVILFIYVLFFGIIVLLSKASSEVKTNEKKLSPLEQFYNHTSFSFEVEINEERFNGVYVNDKLLINYNEVEYNEENINEFMYQDILLYINNKYIYETIKDKKPYSKTEYNDNKTSITYIIDEVEIEVYENDKIYQINITIDDNTYKIIYN